MTYAEKLKDPRWQRKRLEIFQRDSFQCQFAPGFCSPEEQLHVHHKRYIKGRDPWNYDNDDLVTVCAEHHEFIEELRQRIGSVLHDHINACAFGDLLELIKSTHWYEASMIVSGLVHCPGLLEEVYELSVARSNAYRNKRVEEDERMDRKELEESA